MPLLDGGYRLGDLVRLRSAGQAAVTSISGCSLIWHGIRSGMKRKHIWGGWGSCAIGPLRINGLGEPFHTMPLHVCLPCQQCDLVSCPKGGGGKGGNVLYLLEQPPRTLPERHHSHSMGCNQPPAQPRMRDQALCCTNLICLAANGIFQSVCRFSSTAK